MQARVGITNFFVVYLDFFKFGAVSKAGRVFLSKKVSVLTSWVQLVTAVLKDAAVKEKVG